MDKTNLVKVSTYARENNFSVQWVYKLIEKGELKLVEIDTVKFIEV